MGEGELETGLGSMWLEPQVAAETPAVDGEGSQKAGLSPPSHADPSAGL